MIQRLCLAAIVALIAAPVVSAQQSDCPLGKCKLGSPIGDAKAASKSSVGFPILTIQSCEECCEIPMLGQIQCIGQMLRIGGGVADKADGCKCCGDCKKGECCCTKKPKTAAIGAGIGCVVGAACGTEPACPTTTLFRAAALPAQPCVAAPTKVYEVVCDPIHSSYVYPQPVSMPAQPPMPYVVSERRTYIAPKPMHICVAKSEPDSEVRKVEWRTESHFLGTSGHLEIQNGDTTVCCEKMIVKTTGCGAIKVCCDGGQVSIDGPCVKGKADHVSTDHQGCLVLKGNVRVACEKDGQSVAVQGSHCIVHVADGKIAVQMK